MTQSVQTVRTFRNTLLSLALVMAVVFLPSCQKTKLGHNFLPLTERLISDTTSSWYYPLSAFNPKSVDGTIALFGASDEVARMTEYLLTADNFNNVDGSSRPDSLPDFAGEIFAPVLDIANTPYQQYISENSEALLGDIAVRAFLSAIDTAVYTVPADSLKSYPRTKAKMVVFPSSLFAAYGAADIDTLNAISGRKVPVIFTPNAMVEYLYSRHSQGMNVGVLTTSDIMGAGVYSSVFPSIMKKYGDESTNYYVFCPDTARSESAKLNAFLSMFETSGVGGKLSAIIVDDSTVDLGDMREAVDALISSVSAQDAPYRNLLASDFEMVDPMKAVSTVCYKYLRTKNLFTHRISYPEVKCYAAMPSYAVKGAQMDVVGDLEYSFKYGRTPDDGPSVFSVVPLRDEYISRAFLEYMETYTQNLFSLYVR